MRKINFLRIGIYALVSVVLLQSCKDDSNLAAPPPVPDQSFVEEFDTVSAALSRGWKLINVSVPKGSGIWQQGGDITPWFQAFSSNGSNAGFIGADYLSTSAAAGIISNWLVSPVVTYKNGDKISFYTRTLIYNAAPPGAPVDSTDYANRLQLLISQNDGLNVGNGDESGDFSALIDINPNYIEYHSNPALYSPFAYPARWTRFETTISGLNAPKTGRLAFRYFVEGAGSNGLGSGVAIDKVEFKSASK
ncbi:MAG: hypothetical protein JWP69_1833 [Flaviaesturariibacter sp.]|nr:hypothetical protein [Flaviaesturariibacter sp.]